MGREGSTLSDRFPLGFCGGTLVASKYVITAAHCMKGKTADQMAVRIGDHELSTDTEPLTLPPKTVNVKTITDHPDYNQNIVDGYDISLLELEEELDLDVYTPACLKKHGDDDDALQLDSHCRRIGLSTGMGRGPAMAMGHTSPTRPTQHDFGST